MCGGVSDFLSRSLMSLRPAHLTSMTVARSHYDPTNRRSATSLTCLRESDLFISRRYAEPSRTPGLPHRSKPSAGSVTSKS